MYLNEDEKLNIEAFCKNETMFEAVRKVLLAGLYSHGVLEAGEKHNPLLNGAFGLVALTPTNPIPDEMIGKQLRAQWAGIEILHKGYDELKKIKSNKGTEVLDLVNEGV